MKVKRIELKYKAYKYIYDFQQHQTIRSFRDSIINNKFSVNRSWENQSNLLRNIVKFNDKSIKRSKENKIKNTFESATALYEGRELLLNVFKSEIFPLKPSQKMISFGFSFVIENIIS